MCIQAGPHHTANAPQSCTNNGQHNDKSSESNCQWNVLGSCRQERGGWEGGWERREVQGSMKEHLPLKNGHMSVLIPEPLTSESSNRRTPSTSTSIIDWSHIRATVRDSTVYGYNRSWLQHTTLTLPAEKSHSRTKMMLMYTLRGLWKKCMRIYIYAPVQLTGLDHSREWLQFQHNTCLLHPA